MIQPTDEAVILTRIAGHFSGHWEPNYVRGKLRVDPLYRAARGALDGNPLPILDIGCGMGLLGMYLAEHGQDRDYLGIDNDARKLASARAITTVHYPRMRFVDGDAAGLPEFHGNVAILDALHYMPAAVQQTVLDAAAQRVAAGGVLLIRNVLRDGSWRFWMTVAEEKVLHWTRWMKTGATHFPTREEIVTPLQRHGLVAEVSPLWGRTPYNSWLIVARRTADSSQVAPPSAN